MTCVAVGLTLALVMAWPSISTTGYGRDMRLSLDKSMIAVISSGHTAQTGWEVQGYTVYRLDGGRVTQLCAEVVPSAKGMERG